jgi:peroxiredoxin
LIVGFFPIGEIVAAPPSDVLFLSHFDDNSENERTGGTGTSTGLTFEAGKFNRAVEYNGADQIYYSASGNINRSSGTVEYWYKSSFNWSNPPDNQATFFLYDVNDQASSWTNYLAIHATRPDAPMRLRAELAVGSTVQILESENSKNWNAGDWHHVAVTWDSSSFKLYTDGSLEDEIASPVLLDADRDTIFVGNDMYIQDYSGIWLMDELIIFDNVRSASDISSDYGKSDPFYPEAGSAQDTGAPSISSIAAGSLTKTSATITWTTNELADSFVEYGTDTSYGAIAGQEDSVTNHSVVLTGLTPGTTYHFRVKSTDGNDNQTTSSDNTFTTVEIDRTPPKIALAPYEAVYAISKPTISGTVTDDLSGVDSLSYTLDGINFIPISGTASFNIALEFADGNYRLQVKAIDKEGNVALSSPARFVIDTLPPSLAASSFFLGPQKLIPDSDGSLVVSSGAKLTLTISAVGGPTMVQVKTNGETYSLQRIAGTNLWQGEVVFSSQGQFNLEGLSEDGAGNKVVQNLNSINVLSKGVVTDGSGEPLEEAEVFVYVWVDEASPFLTGEWQLWQSEGYGQQNSQKTDEGGGFYYFLPEGKYQLVVEKDGFQDFVSQAFAVDKPTPLNLSIRLSSGLSFKVADISVKLPWFLDIFAKKQEISLGTPVFETETLVGKKAEDFTLPSTLGGDVSLGNYRGRAVLITFWASWDPACSEQIAVLDKLDTSDVVFLSISVQESLVRVASLLRRGGYDRQSLVDEDGKLVEGYQVFDIPKHILIGDDGVMKKVKVGTMTKDEILNFVEL